MDAVFENEFCNLQIYLSSSCYGIEFRTSMNSDKLRACIEKAYVVVTFSQSISQFEFPPTNNQQLRTPYNLDMKRCRIL